MNKILIGLMAVSTVAAASAMAVAPASAGEVVRAGPHGVSVHRTHHWRHSHWRHRHYR